METGSSIALDDFIVRLHEGIFSTNRARGKHNLSFAPTSPILQGLEMHIGERIKAARMTRQWSQARLAEAINTAQTTVSSWERGRTEPTREDVGRVAQALGLSSSEIETSRTDEAASSCPIVGYVGAGAAMNLFSHGQGPLGFTTSPPGANARTVAAEVRGDSLGSFFNQWLVFYDDVHAPVSDRQIGELCVCGLSDGRVLVKKIQRARQHGLFHLLSQTEEPILDVPLDWAARVTHMRPR